MNTDKADQAVKQCTDKVRDLKQSLSNFLIEYEQRGVPNGGDTIDLSWPNLLDQMNVLSSQITTIRNTIKDKLPILRSHGIIPMCLSQDKDPQLEQMTERRITTFTHDFMPTLLRTKNHPDIEEREKQLMNINNKNAPTTTITTQNDVQRRVQELNSVIHSITNMFMKTKEATEKTEKQYNLQPYNNSEDTKRLMEAMNSGIGLKIAETQSAVTTSNTDAINAQPSTSQARHVNVPRFVARAANRR
ncbi:unnamed protein product [Didymodactylos carnosus]|uniref:Mediator of RNA polymerase II transcription subunit 8 n=1 Tax=Didymodactylos carnosus TaxID=1234261 RepID=A0A813P4X8_9BILA|nr:unnamed protein product [Didymodactylos carnosus]CAF0780541.1 unnamed protein product [Didymodactylos carnosus]CAF3529285.1 unnamed protein product [Didymodactylos carnosus]CAF3562099.1 unnamed protein product [Didymodactylos carnosus]